MKITVPESMADITVRQYKKIANLKSKEGSKKWLIQAISIFCNITQAQARKLTLAEMDRIGAIVGHINNEDNNNQALQKIIEYRGVKYGFHPNLSDLTVGEFADLETYCGNGFFDNLNEILSILYRPIKSTGGEFYTIEDYTGEMREKYWDDLKMDVVLGAINFFLSIGEILVIGLPNYSKEMVDRI